MQNVKNGTRTGFTTGTCATAACVLAALRLQGEEHRHEIHVRLPRGEDATLLMHDSGIDGEHGWASIYKDAGDDPDITHGALILAELWKSSEKGVQFIAGSGVGTVTKLGLQVPCGEAAINPVPRSMIREHLLALAPGWVVVLSIEEGQTLAMKTFNPRLGIIGGLSIIGTTGIVRPFSHGSQLCSIRCAMGVAFANEVKRLAFVPGHMGELAVRAIYPELIPEAIIEVGNDWGFSLDLFHEKQFESLIIAGHPGKLFKIFVNAWDTHSSRSPSALPILKERMSMMHQESIEHLETVDGCMQVMQSWEGFSEWVILQEQELCTIVKARLKSTHVEVHLTDMKGRLWRE